jgi:cholesterol transport system auxiliary component
MTSRPQRHRPGLVAAAALLPLLLAGCGGLLSGPPARPLYRLDPTFAFAAALPHVGLQVLVAAPSAPSGLDTARIALSRTAVGLDYFADAEWTDRAPYLVQTALVEGFQKSGALPAVGPESGDLRADFVIETAIRDFEAAYEAPNGPPRAVVTLNVQLVRMPQRSIVGQTVVRREQQAAANTIADVVHAFDAALGGAAAEIVRWTVSNPSLSERRAR